MSQARPTRGRRGGQARRRGAGRRRGPGGRIPTLSRVAAFLLFATLVAALVAAIHGPWLRVTGVTWAGERYTPDAQLRAVLDGYRGAPLLAVRGDELARKVGELPAVAEVQVEARLPGALTVTVHEKQATYLWLTSDARLVVAADGTVIAALARDADLPPALVPLPAVDDGRAASRDLGVGDALVPAELRAADRLLGLDPELLGADAEELGLRVDDEYGFLLTSSEPAWTAAFGFYQLDPTEGESAALARLEAQLRAVRTLFAEVGDASVGWLDARNPGKVYWAP